MGGGMRFRVLGALRVWDGSTASTVRAAQQRAVLAILLLCAGRTVSTDQLVDEIWGERPPRSAVVTVQGYVKSLRRLLGGGTAGPLATRGRGYELSVADGDLDSLVFGRLLESGRRSAAAGSAERAAAAFTEALALWRGAPLADVPATPTVAAEVSRLDNARMAAVEGRLAAQLDLGGHADVVDELQTLVGAHPLRERLWAFLITALYRCGRRAEALDAFRRVRRRLVTDLGLEPGQELRELQAAVLADDPRLAVPVRGPVQLAGGTAVPAEMPRDVPAFTGRHAACAALDDLVRATDASLTAVVTGMAGVGKSAFAVHWARRNASRFPDGQLFVDLQGHAAGPPVPPVRALARFLRALGAAAVPDDTDEAAATYRSLLADRRVLVVLDNARHPDQVRPLLPSGPGCLALVTSRNRLVGLVARDGAVPVALDVLSPADGRLLITRLLGRDDHDPAVVAALADRCGQLPLALRIAAANLATRPGTTLAEYAALLATDPLDALQVDGDAQAGVRVAFDHSYAALPAPAQRMFRLLGRLSGPDVTPAVAAASAGLPTDRAGELLRQLADANLLAGHHRYRMHDLVRRYAAKQHALTQREPNPDPTCLPSVQPTLTTSGGAHEVIVR